MSRQGQSRTYERVALLVAVGAVLVVALTAIVDSAGAQVPGAVEEPSEVEEPVAAEGPDLAEGPEAEDAPSEPEPAEDAAAEPDPAAEDAAAERRRLRLTLSRTSPGKLFFDNGRKARFVFALSGRGRSDVTVRAINVRRDEVVRHWKLRNARGGKNHAIVWDGRKQRKGFAPEGKYTFKVYRSGRRGSDPIPETSGARGKTRIALHRHKFPLPARHSYGDGFGAGRDHKGQDLFAACGKKIRAARGGRVQFSGYHSAAGYYAVIDGRGTGWDYVYMHMEKRGRVKEGQRVRTGDVVGRNSDTGNASGCHLHFEMWSPTGWYEGGEPRPPTRMLRKWDRYS